MHASRPAIRGAALALLAAALFGLSTPLVQRLGVGLGSFSTAALLYAGAAVVGALLRQPVAHEAQLQRGDAGRLLAMASFGAVIGPVALAWLWYRETLDRRVLVAMALLSGGGAALVLDQAQAGAAALWGLLAVMAATTAWGVDNALSRPLAERDPGQVVLAKCALGAAATTVLALLRAEPQPPLWSALGLLAVGASGYGLSLRFYLLAQRAFGAARTGSVFAFAPFIGALGAVALGDRSGTPLMALAGALMVAGLCLHLAEAHAHLHEHEPLDHEHAHTHDDGHHDDHTHSVLPVGAHSHPHHHTARQHAHPHVPDAHHQHSH